REHTLQFQPSSEFPVAFHRCAPCNKRCNPALPLPHQGVHRFVPADANSRSLTMASSRRFVPGLTFALVAMLAAVRPTARGADENVPYTRVARVFAKHFYGCNGNEKAKGKLRIDKLNPDFIKGNNGDHWRDVLDRLNFGDMPPASEPALKKEDRELMTAWL